MIRSSVGARPRMGWGAGELCAKAEAWLRVTTTKRTRIETGAWRRSFNDGTALQALEVRGIEFIDERRRPGGAASQVRQPKNTGTNLPVGAALSKAAGFHQIEQRSRPEHAKAIRGRSSR